MKRHLFVLSLLLLITSASAQSVPSDGWVAWKVPVPTSVRIGCWDHGEGFSIMDEEGSGEMLVVARLKGGKITTLRGHDVACAPKTDAQRIEMDVNASVDFLARHIEDPADERIVSVLAMHNSPRVEPLLERFAGSGYRRDVREQAVFWLGQRGGEPGFRFLRDLVRASKENRDLQEKAVFAISQSPVAGATEELIDLARNHKSSEIRRQAIFWLGQKAGSKAAAELRRAVDEDPDDDVREHAVFAISQLPRERSVPLLIDLVRNHKSAHVREKAMFWLAQTNDPRALDLIEEILTK